MSIRLANMINVNCYSTNTNITLYECFYRGIVRLIKVTAFLLKSHSRNLTVWKVFERLVEANPSAISLLYEDQKWSRSEV